MCHGGIPRRALAWMAKNSDAHRSFRMYGGVREPTGRARVRKCPAGVGQYLRVIDELGHPWLDRVLGNTIAKESLMSRLLARLALVGGILKCFARRDGVASRTCREG